MVYVMENPIKNMDDKSGYPYDLGNLHMVVKYGYPYIMKDGECGHGIEWEKIGYVYSGLLLRYLYSSTISKWGVNPTPTAFWWSTLPNLRYSAHLFSPIKNGHKRNEQPNN